MDEERETQSRAPEAETGSGVPDAPLAANGQEKNSSGLFDWIQCIVSALVACILIFVFIGRTVGVDGESMLPTLENGDRLIITRLFYSEPQYGDIVVLRKDSFKETPIIKRVIATEGQTVDIGFETGVVYVDGVALDEPYTNEPTNVQEDFEGPVTVPENCVFVMGDNRNHSADSRMESIGCVDVRYIIGHVVLRLTPVSKFGAVS